MMQRAKRLLEWNRRKLRHDTDLQIGDLYELFAPKFKVFANERVYEATYENYFEFLQNFRADIVSIDYQVQEYVVAESAVTLPLKATVTKTDGTVDLYQAMLLFKYDSEGKIVHWQEVYATIGG